MGRLAGPDGPRPWPQERHRRRQPEFEDLEARIALAANLSLVGQAYLVDEEDNPLDMAAVPEGCPIFIHKEWTATDLPPFGRRRDGCLRRQERGRRGRPLAPRGMALGRGRPGHDPWFEYWGGWKTTPGVHTAGVMLDGFDNFAETDETSDNSYDFTFTTVAKPMVTIRATGPLAMEAGQQAGIFTITREGNNAFKMTVHLAVSGTATPGADYSALPETVVMPAGVSSITIGVFPVDDAETEPRETVVVTVTPDDCYAVGARGRPRSDQG